MFPDKVVHGSPSFTVFGKRSILDVWQGSEYLSYCYYKVYALKMKFSIKDFTFTEEILNGKLRFFAVSIEN